LVASSADGSIFASSDSGAFWTDTHAPSSPWGCLASSSDGCKLVAVVNGGGIYTWQTTPHPLLNFAPSAGGLLLSWIIPSMPFVLQQSSGLDGGWAEVSTTPALNYTNLHYEVSLAKPTGATFYRLVSR